MKLNNADKGKNANKYMQVGVSLIVKLINKWVDKVDISTLIDFEGNVIREGFEEEINN